MGRVGGGKAWTKLLGGLWGRAREKHWRTSEPSRARASDGLFGRGFGCGDGARMVALERAIGRLAPFEREVWLLAARDGSTDRAIAEQLGIECEAVSRYLAAALVALADALDEPGGVG